MFPYVVTSLAIASVTLILALTCKKDKKKPGPVDEQKVDDEVQVTHATNQSNEASKIQKTKQATLTVAKKPSADKQTVEKQPVKTKKVIDPYASVDSFADSSEEAQPNKIEQPAKWTIKENEEKNKLIQEGKLVKRVRDPEYVTLARDIPEIDADPGYEDRVAMKDKEREREKSARKREKEKEKSKKKKKKKVGSEEEIEVDVKVKKDVKNAVEYVDIASVTFEPNDDKKLTRVKGSNTTLHHSAYQKSGMKSGLDIDHTYVSLAACK